MKIYRELQQRTDEWRQLKVGKLSASKAEAIMKPRGLGVGGRTLALELMAERLIGDADVNFVTEAMQHGIDMEYPAREIYERTNNVKIEEVGGIELGDLWYSPDGLVGNDGLIEIKAPGRKKHMDNLTWNECPVDHKAQIQFGLFVSGRKWCDFISFNPEFPDKYAMKIIRVERDEAYIETLKTRISEFNILTGTIKI